MFKRIQHKPGKTGMNEAEKTARRPGRREKVAGKPKTDTVTFRVRAGMREDLTASAKARDLSVSEEVERRCLLSFDLASSPSNEYIIRTVAAALRLSETTTGRTWMADRTTAKMACAAMQAAASIILAHHSDETADPEYTAMAEKVGVGNAMMAATIYSGMPIDKLLEVTKPDREAFSGLQAMIEPRTEILARLLREGAQPASSALEDEPELPLVDEQGVADPAPPIPLATDPFRRGPRPMPSGTPNPVPVETPKRTRAMKI